MYVLFFITSYLQNRWTDLHNRGIVRFVLAAQLFLDKNNYGGCGKPLDLVKIFFFSNSRTYYEDFRKVYHDYDYEY